MAALNKIAYNSPSRQNPSELETTIAGALFDLENNTTDLKASLRPLQFASAREVRVSFLDFLFDYLFFCLYFEINWVIRVLIWSVYKMYRGKRGDFDRNYCCTRYNKLGEKKRTATILASSLLINWGNCHVQI